MGPFDCATNSWPLRCVVDEKRCKSNEELEREREMAQHFLVQVGPIHSEPFRR
jgi:hypothetical protein